MKKIISGLLILTMFIITTTGIYAQEDTSFNILFSAEKMEGKVFPEGNNMEISNKIMFDTYINSIVISTNSNSMILSFCLKEQLFSISVIPISASENNVNNDHFVFSPQNYENLNYDIVNINMTTNANIHDLLPANYDLIGTTMLTIILKHKLSGDIYYWQGNLQSPLSFERNDINYDLTILNNIKNTTLSSSFYNEDIIRESANEFYYMNNTSCNFILTKEEFNSAAYNNSISNVENISNKYMISTNNPFYDLGVPNSAFTSVTNSWAQGVAIAGVRNYYTYSYSRLGSSNVYTRTMILNFDQATLSLGLDSSNNVYKHSRELQIEVSYNETVIYYPAQNVYDYMLGGNDVVKMYPAIELKKSAGTIGQVLTSREFSGSGKKSSTINVSALLSITAGIIDNVLTNGWVTTSLNILQVLNIGNENYTLGSTRKLYRQTYILQNGEYDVGLSGLKMEMDGYIISPSNYFRCLCEFSGLTQSQANQTTWVLYMNLV